MTKKVTFSESIGLRVANRLRACGFAGAYPVGVDHNGEGQDTLYIVLRVRKPGKFFFSSDQTFIFGTLYLNHPDIGAKTKENWILHLKGRDNRTRATEVAQVLVEAFDVNVHVRLEQEELEVEYPDD